MSVRPRHLLAGVAAIALAVVVALFLTGAGGSAEGETVHGMPERGFPMRGSLAGDQDTIAGAVKAWRDHASEAADSDDESDRDNPNTKLRPDEDDDITVLWAGRVDDNKDVVMLEGGDLVAEMARGTTGNWYVSGERARDLNSTPGVPVGAGHSVLTPAGGRWRYVNASKYSGGAKAFDGLFNGGNSTVQGFVLPVRDRGDDDLISIYVAGVGARLMTPKTFPKLEEAIADDDARALWIATEAGNNSLVRELEQITQGLRESREPQPLTVVWAGDLPRHPHAVIVAQGRRSMQSLALGHADPPDDEDEEEGSEGSQLLGFGTGGLAGSNQPDAVVGGAYMELDDLSYLVLAGTGAKTLHALVGKHELSRPAPAAVIDTSTLTGLGDTTDTVIYGLTADGDVLSPLR